MTTPNAYEPESRDWTEHHLLKMRCAIFFPCAPLPKLLQLIYLLGTPTVDENPVLRSLTRKMVTTCQISEK